MVPVDDGDDLVVIIHNQVVAIQVVMGERVRHAPAGSIDHSFEPIDSCRELTAPVSDPRMVEVVGKELDVCTCRNIRPPATDPGAEY